jgi:hypothetical protein
MPAHKRAQTANTAIPATTMLIIRSRIVDSSILDFVQLIAIVQRRPNSPDGILTLKISEEDPGDKRSKIRKTLIRLFLFA